MPLVPVKERDSGTDVGEWNVTREGLPEPSPQTRPYADLSRKYACTPPDTPADTPAAAAAVVVCLCCAPRQVRILSCPATTVASG